MSNKRNEIRQLLRDAKSRGWTSQYTGGGHYKLVHDSGAVVYCSSTPRTGRALAATKARIKRIEAGR